MVAGKSGWKTGAYLATNVFSPQARDLLDGLLDYSISPTKGSARRSGLQNATHNTTYMEHCRQVEAKVTITG